jgi:hypothetical protein
MVRFCRWAPQNKGKILMRALVRHICLLATILALPLAAENLSAQDLIAQKKKLLDLTQGNWAYFRDFNGGQLIYFTHLEVYRCGIETVSYSLNSEALDREWELQPCDRAKPDEVTTDRRYISLPLSTAHMVAVRLTYTDGSQSPVARINTDNKLVQ